MDTFLIFLTIFAITCGVVAIWLFIKGYNIYFLIRKKIVEIKKHRKAEKYMNGEFRRVISEETLKKRKNLDEHLKSEIFGIKKENTEENE